MYADTVKLGIVEVDRVGRVTTLLEKPPSNKTTSRLAVSSTYLYKVRIIFYYYTRL